MKFLHSLRALKYLPALLPHLPRIAGEYAPVQATFFDGVSRQVPRHVALLFKLWRLTAHLHKESSEAYQLYRGGDFLDIGAFHGWYSLLLAPKARPGASLISFEPDSRCVPSLLKNISVAQSLFPDRRFSTISQPCGTGRDGRAEYPAGPGSHPKFGSSAVGPDSDDASASVRVDAFVSDTRIRPCLVKIDVEGAEYDVLQGMTETLHTHQPGLLLEVHPQWQPAGVTVASICTLLETAGYTHRVIDASPIAERWVATPNI